MYKHRFKYWSSSKLAHKILAKFCQPKPSHATPEEWNNWEKIAKHSSPIIYNIVENGFDLVQDIVYFPSDVWDNFRLYCRNRFATQTHLMRTNLEKGKWHDNDVRMLHGMFELLVDFVEVEKASLASWLDIDAPSPWWHKFRALRFTEYRNREIALQYLQWEMSLTTWDGVHFTPQALAAQEIYDLYIWWTDIRPNRPDPYEVSGWNKWAETHSDGLSVMSISHEESALLSAISRIKQEYNDEDQQNLIRLVKIRSHLWT